MEIDKFMKCFVWKAFNLGPECECDSNFATQHQVKNIVKEQFRKYELTELGLSALHLKDWTGLSLETFHCY